MERKFKNYQRVVVLGMIINGDRRDCNAMIEGFHLTTGKYIVNVNTILVYLPEDKLMDFGEYWDLKNKEKK